MSNLSNFCFFIIFILLNTASAKDFDPDLADIFLNTIKGEYVFSQDFSHSTAMKIEENDSVIRFALHFTPKSYYDEAHLTLSHKSKMLNALEDEILRRAGYKMHYFSVAERVAMSKLPKPNDKSSKVQKMLTDVKARAMRKQKVEDYEIREAVMSYLSNLDEKITIPFNLRPDWGKVSLVVDRFPTTKSYFDNRKKSDKTGLFNQATPSHFAPEAGMKYVKPFPTNYLELRIDLGSWLIQVIVDEIVNGKKRLENAKKDNSAKAPAHMYT